MKKVYIENKEYYQQEECDIPKISMPLDRDIFTKYKYYPETICSYCRDRSFVQPLGNACHSCERGYMKEI